MARLIRVQTRIPFTRDWLVAAPGPGPHDYYTVWHWALIDTTPDEIAYFCALGDNE